MAYRPRRASWGLRLIVAAAILPALFLVRAVPMSGWRAAASVLAAVLRAYLFASAHIAQIVLIGLALVLGRLAYGAARFAWLPPAAKRHYPAAVWARFRWRWLARNLGLSYPDKAQHAIRPVVLGTGAPQPRSAPARDKVRFPRARFRPDAYGLVASVRPVPGVGLEELTRAAPYIADAWRCVRVQVTSPAAGRYTVRGLRRDPLCDPLPASVLPAFDGRHVILGRDEWGQMRRADLANLSGSAFSGNPGRGKTEAALSLAVQLVPSPLVDTWILDGGACDWAAFADAAAGYVADDLEAAGDMLAELDGRMCIRRRNLTSDRGARNGWTAGGPAEDYRLQWVLIEEAPFYFDLEAVRGDRKREAQVRTCRGLAAQLLRRGRAPLFHTTLIAQKGTGTAGLPPDLRDLCGLRWSFGVATTEAAAAVLGDDIRQHATMSPTLLQGPDHVGVASVLLRTGQSPYSLVKFPAVGDDLADRTASTAAARVRALDMPSGTPVVNGDSPQPVAAEWPAP